VERSPSDGLHPSPGRGADARDGEDRLRSLCANVPVGLLLADAAGAATLINERFSAIFGAPAAELLGQGWIGRVHPEDREVIDRAWALLVREGRERASELRVVHHGGTAVWCRWHAAPLPSASGPADGFVMLLEDVTASRSQREDLEASEERFRSIFENFPVGIAVATEEGRILRANPTLARMVGYAEDELVGRSFLEITHPDDLRESTRLREECAAGRRTLFNVEKRYLRKDGAAIWVHVTAALQRSSRGALEYVSLIQDIDARKKAEESVRQLSGRLLQLQDEERRRLARSLHETASQTVTLLGLNLQRLAKEPSKQAALLADSSSLIDQLSREIRTVSHLLHPPLLDEVGLAPALRWYADAFAQRSGLAVGLEIDDVGRFGQETETSLFRVVQECLANAHRHSRAKTVGIRLHRTNGKILLTVKDDGAGMPRQVLDRLRAPDASLVGVGLAGMQERIKQLGGRLEIASGGWGTAIRAALPVA